MVDDYRSWVSKFRGRYGLLFQDSEEFGNEDQQLCQDFLCFRFDILRSAHFSVEVPFGLDEQNVAVSCLRAHVDDSQVASGEIGHT